MKKGYFAVYFDGSVFETTNIFKSIAVLKRDTKWFEGPVVQGHVIIFKSDSKSFFPVEEAWAPAEPKLSWRKFQRS